MKEQYIVAVIGATGNVGREVLNYLDSRDFPISKIFAVASADSVGKEVSFGDKNLKLITLKEVDFAKIHLAFFCTSADISRQYAPIAASAGCIVIDKSTHFRLNPDVPLIVPEANHLALNNFQQQQAKKGSAEVMVKTMIGIDEKFSGGIIANPNCCTIPLAVALKPLDNAARIKRLVISTYQSVSGAGKAAMDELYRQTKAKFVFGQVRPQEFPHQIAFNLFPHIGDFREDGYTEEEYKIEHELKKIIGSHLATTVTCVRVPVFVSHAMSVNVEFDQDINAKEAEELLYEASGITVHSLDNEHRYITPIEAVEYDDVYVSRIRDDLSQKNTINLWIITDNLRKGAALNAVQIAEEITRNQTCSFNF
jgi:aspartate-semialdehyde dehydrogenase